MVAVGVPGSTQLARVQEPRLVLSDARKYPEAIEAANRSLHLNPKDTRQTALRVSRCCSWAISTRLVDPAKRRRWIGRPTVSGSGVQQAAPSPDAEANWRQ